MGKIAVFCSASPVENERFVNAAKELGRLIGLRKDTLIYGGASLGLMETVASAVKEYGGCVTGVVPEIIEERNAVSGLCDSIIKVKDLNERKQEMNRLADLFVALPGGIGTLDELFTVAAAVSIGYMDKKLILCNIDGFYDTLIRFVGELKEEGFLRHRPEDYFIPVKNMDELKQIIEL